MKQSLRGTAVHEAGHTVIAYRLGILADTVTIKPEVGRDGIGQSRRWLGTSWSEAPCGDGSTDDDQVVVFFAGLAGQRLVEPDDQVRDGAEEDYRQAAEVHQQEQPPPHLEQRAAELVQQNRAAIEAVAEALLEYETLHGDSATLIVDCIDEGKDWRILLPQFWQRFGLGRGGCPH